MVLFLTYVTITLLMTSRSIINILRDRFPHPVDLATLSIFYYGVPLSVAGYFNINYNGEFFLASFADDQGLAVMSIQYITLSILALHLGCRWGRLQGRRPTRLTWFSIVNTSALERALFGFIGLIVMVFIGIYLFGFQEFMAGYATNASDNTGMTGNAVIYITLELIGFNIAYAVILGMCIGRIPFKWLICACLATLLVMLAIRAKRLEIVSSFIPATIIFLSQRSTMSAIWWRVTIVGIGVVVLVVVSALRISADLDWKQGVYLAFSEGLYAGHSLPGITERLLIHTLSYEYGMRFFYALGGFIPNFLWENKDKIIYAINIDIYTPMMDVKKGVSPLGATSFLAEVVLQGDFFAILIVYQIMGFLFDRIMRFQDVWDESLSQGAIPARFGAYLVAVAIFIPHFRDGIIPAIKIALQIGVFFVLLFGIQYIKKPIVFAQS